MAQFAPALGLGEPAPSTFVPGKLVAKLRNPQPHFGVSKLDFAPALVKEVAPLFPVLTSPHPLSALIELRLFPGVNLERALHELRKDPRLVYVEPVPYAKPTGGPTSLPNDPWLNAEADKTWGHTMIKAPAAWEISKGDPSIVIAIIDDGVDFAHPDLKDRVYYNRAERFGQAGVDDDRNGYVDDSVGYDFADRENGQNLNAGPHGTWVTGISSATPNNGIGLAGVGYNCRFMPLKVVDKRLRFDATHIYQAIRYAADNEASIINISYAYNLSQPLRWQQEVINYAVLQKNVLIVAASGNGNGATGREDNVYPASYDNVISVGGSNFNDARLADGIYSRFIDLLAPGIVSTTSPTPINYQFNLQGSSFAAPYVAGAAGLIMAKYPELKALQVGELLRATTDNVYGVAANAPFQEMLGKGRLNVLRALQERNTAQSIRLKSHTVTNRFGEYAFPGDTLMINARFINYLKPSTSAARVQLSTTSPYATVMQGDFGLGPLGTMDSVSNQRAPFRIRLSSDTPPGAMILFRLGFSDASYTDYQYFFVQAAPDHLDLQINKFSLTSGANGRLGFVDEANKQGLGIRYENQPVLQDAGLLIGLGNEAVSNSVYSSPGRKSGDFVPVRNIRIEQKGIQHIGTYSAFADTTIANRIGVFVEQRIYGRTNTPNHTYFIVHYDVTNIGNGDMDSLLVGLFADWDLDGTKDRALWDRATKTGYVTNQANTRFMGIKILGNGTAYYGIDKRQTSGPINYTDGFSTTEKNIALSSGIANSQVGGPQGSDVAQVVGTRLNNFRRGEKRRITFIVAGASSLADLQAATQQAELFLDPRSSRGPMPNVPAEICASQPALFIQPTNGKRFRFYRAPQVSEPVATGSVLPITLADTAQQFYISSVDSLIESEVLPYRFTPRWATARFVSVDSLNMVDSAVVQFSDQSRRPLAWRWDFGDGAPMATTRNPKHSYSRPGLFTVTLTMTDSAGCAAVFNKKVKVVRIVRGPQPVIAPVIYACRTAPVVLRPGGGSQFRFFISPPANNPVFTGRSYTLTDTTIARLWITNIDSAIESLPVLVNLNRSKLQANFDYSPKADTIIYDQITFTDKSTANFDLVRWEWDLGNGRRQTGRSFTYMYQAQGVYSVKLKVTDILGCTDSTTRTFRVGRRGPTPVVASPVALCQGNSAIVRPMNGSRFNFYTSPTLAQPVFTGREYRFVPAQSMRLYVTNADSIVESAYREVVINVTILSPDFTFGAGAGYEIRFQGPNTPMVTYEWAFGDGSFGSNAANPAHTYRRPGTYQVSLTLRSAEGCVATLTKTVQVRHVTPLPVIQGFRTCPGKEIVLVPQGNGPFRFYSTRPPSQMAASGMVWNIGALYQDRTVYVTQTDSIGESEAVEVTIKVDRISADFTFRTGPAGVVVNDSLFFEAGERNAASWEWDLGNGLKVNGRTANVKYNLPGVYRVKLTVRNAQGCEIYQVMELPVVLANAPTVIHNFRVTPNPSDGNVNISITLGQFSRVSVRVYNVIGQLVLAYEDESVLQRDYPISLKDYARGVYIVQLVVGKEVLNTRLVLNH